MVIYTYQSPLECSVRRHDLFVRTATTGSLVSISHVGHVGRIQDHDHKYRVTVGKAVVYGSPPVQASLL